MVKSRRIGGMIERYGRRVQIEENGVLKKTRAIIQPLRYKNKMYVSGSFLPPGFADGGHYLYLGNAWARLDLLPADTLIRTDEESYLLKRGEKVLLGDEILYIWAILQSYVEDAFEGGEG